MTTNGKYWNSEGKYQALYDRLEKLIPIEGSVKDAQRNPCLERLRIAVNCYYDLFNNGLCNRAAEFRRIFGFAGTWIAKTNFPYYAPLEQRMDGFILAAAMEQLPDLLGAAPTMLEALKDIIEQADKTLLPIGADLADSIRVFGKQAVAKAEGKG